MITLVLGGSRSGKSEVAENLAGGLPSPVSYVATAAAGDEEMAARIAAHRRRRPASWRTVEVGSGDDLAAVMEELGGTVLVDSLGAWVAAHEGFVVDGAKLCSALGARCGDTVVVTDEVGLGVHPSTESGRRFRDALGALNRQVASTADEALLVVAGRVLRLERV